MSVDTDDDIPTTAYGMGVKGLRRKASLDSMNTIRRGFLSFVFLVLLMIFPLFILYALTRGQEADAATSAQYTVTGSPGGGDCGQIGAWNEGAKTCTLTHDIDINNDKDGIWIVGDGITLEGGGKTVRGKDAPGTAGVRVLTGNGSRVRNLSVRDFASGIQLDAPTEQAAVTNVYASSNVENGILVSGSTNTISGNTLSQNPVANIYLEAAGTATVSGNTINGPSSGSGIYIASSTGGNFSGNSISDNNEGIRLYPASTSNHFSGNTLSGNTVGITFAAGSNGNTFRNNTVSSSGSGTAFRIDNSSNNSIYNNDFLTSAAGDSVTGTSSGNSFSQDLPAGGNYWQRYDSAGEGCSDANRDDFCDAPYAPDGGNFSDDHPWRFQDRWTYASPIDFKWHLLGGSPGTATEAEQTIAGGRYREYENGRLYLNSSLGSGSDAVFWVHGGIMWMYDNKFGREGGVYGLPRSDELPLASPPGAVEVQFDNGRLYWSPTTGTHGLQGTFLDRFLNVPGTGTGGPGANGLPTGDAYGAQGIDPTGHWANTGFAQDMQNATVTIEPGASPSAGKLVRAGINAEYRRLGGPLGPMHLITVEEHAITVTGHESDQCSPGVSCPPVEADFEMGYVFWSISTGSHAVMGGIYQKYLWAGGPSGRLGLPTTGEYAISLPGGGMRQAFEHGFITWGARYGTWVDLT